MEEHCWPPLSYELAMEKYRREYLEQEEEEEEGEEGEGEGGAGSEGNKRIVDRKRRSKTVKTLRGRERCKVM